MIVVADTTPLNYLALIGEIELLPALYETILIPLEVHRELLRAETPAPVRTWAESLPLWCEVRRVTSIPDRALSELDAGERDAILLALEANADTLLIDDSEGRREAKRRKLLVTGTLGVLEKAAQRGWIDFHATLREEFLKRNP